MVNIPSIPNPHNRKGIEILDLDGGEAFFAPVEIVTDNLLSVPQLSAEGLTPTTAGVVDVVDKRFVTDAELSTLDDLSTADVTADIITVAGLADVEPELALIGAKTGAEVLLSSTPTVNLNTATATTLFTVPTGKSAVITKAILRLASTNLSTVEFSIGYNSTDFNDVVSNVQPGVITGNTLYLMLTIKAGATIGTTGQLLKLLCNVLQGGVATATIEIFGYLY